MLDIAAATRAWAAAALADAVRESHTVQVPAGRLGALGARIELLLYENGIDLDDADMATTVCAVLEALTRTPGPEAETLGAAAAIATARLRDLIADGGRT